VDRRRSHVIIEGERMTPIMTPLTPEEIKTIRDALKHCKTSEVDDPKLLLELQDSFSKIYKQLQNSDNSLEYLHELRDRFRTAQSRT